MKRLAILFIALLMSGSLMAKGKLITPTLHFDSNNSAQGFYVFTVYALYSDAHKDVRHISKRDLPWFRVDIDNGGQNFDLRWGPSEVYIDLEDGSSKVLAKFDMDAFLARDSIGTKAVPALAPFKYELKDFKKKYKMPDLSQIGFGCMVVSCGFGIDYVDYKEVVEITLEDGDKLCHIKDFDKKTYIYNGACE